MSQAYQAVQWNKHKRMYDLALLGGVALYLIVFIGVTSITHQGDRALSPPILLIRAFGTAAILLLHIILAIGPLARISPRFLPLLYNRRHMGVTMFVLALLHAALATLWYHGFGPDFPLTSIFINGGDWASLSGIPFQALGAVALVILFLMAATSHDFWLANLSPRVWKSLHMLVYVAYALIVMHVALGALQDAVSPIYSGLVALGAATIVTLHLLAGTQELKRDHGALPVEPQQDWVKVATVQEVPDGRAMVVCLKDRERVALFRDGNRLAAVSNVCAHQAGPLGEGAVVDGCLTCPWHGYQYRLEDGTSPPPYTEKIATYAVRVEGQDVLLNPKANAPGTREEPATLSPSISESEPSHAQ